MIATRCLICNESSESNVCDDCSSKKKRCKVCSEMKMDFYSYKNGEMYSTCKECFDKKVRYEFCRKDLNKSYLRSHIKKQHLYPQGYSHSFARVPTQGYSQGYSHGYSRSFTQIPAHTGGDLFPMQVLVQLPTQVPTHNDNNNDDDNKCNRTLIVGPSFCGKTHLLLNKLRLIRLEDPEKQIRIITRSPEQCEDIDIGGASQGIEVEENVGDLEEYRGCCVVFDDILDSNQKFIDPFFTRGRHKLCDVSYLCQSYFDAPKRTVRNNSNLIILFQQTLKAVEHIHRDIAGFDMSCEKFKSLSREAWNEKFNYLLINRLEDKNGSRYRICNESNPKYKIFNPQTDPLNN